MMFSFTVVSAEADACNTDDISNHFEWANKAHKL